MEITAMSLIMKEMFPKILLITEKMIFDIFRCLRIFLHLLYSAWDPDQARK